MVRDYDLDAIRLDTAPYMPRSFLRRLRNAADVEVLGEVTATNLSFLSEMTRAPAEGGPGAVDAVTNFPLYYSYFEGFCGIRPTNSSVQTRGSSAEDGSGTLLPPDLMRVAERITETANALDLSPSRTSSFIDTHDEQRFALRCRGDEQRVANALTLLLLSPGMPTVYYGTEQGFGQRDNRVSLWQTGFPTGTLLYRHLGALNRARQATRGGSFRIVHVAADQLVAVRQGSNSSAWIFTNNKPRNAPADATAADASVEYCTPERSPPLAESGYEWIDILSGEVALFHETTGCFVARNGAARVLVQMPIAADEGSTSVPQGAPNCERFDGSEHSASDRRETVFAFVRIQKTATTALNWVLLHEQPLSRCVREELELKGNRESNDSANDRANTNRPARFHEIGLGGPYMDAGERAAEDVPEAMASELQKTFPNTWCTGGQILNAHISLAAIELAAHAASKQHVRYLVMLREPIARVLSEWHNVLRTADGKAAVRGMWEYRHTSIADGNLSSFLSCSACAVGWSNRQVRMLGADSADLHPRVDESTLQRAVKSLRHAAFVGLAEHFEDAMLLLWHTFRFAGAPVPSFPADINVAPTSEGAMTMPQPTLSDIAQLQRSNQYDMQLYRLAFERFSCDRERMLADVSFPQRNMRYVLNADKTTYRLEAAQRDTAGAMAASTQSASAPAPEEATSSGASLAVEPVSVYVVEATAASLPDPATGWAQYLTDYLRLGESSTGADSARVQRVDASDFFDRGGVDRIAAGSVVVVSDFNLGSPAAYGADGWLLRAPRARALLNVSVPLVVVLYSVNTCNVDWPSSTHHVLYRTGWSAEWHAEWLRSQAAEKLDLRDGWLRDLPFGMVYAPDMPSIGSLHAGWRDAVDRDVLFSFTGTTGYRKPDRDELVDAIHAQNATIESAARRFVARRPRGSSLPPYIFDAWDVEADANSSAMVYHRAIARMVPYEKQLRESVFVLAPAGDMWDSYRTWEAIHAGSIPIVHAPTGTTKGCDQPAAHFVQTMPGAVSVRSWAELPPLLEQLASDVEGMATRQRTLLAALDAQRETSRTTLLQTVSAMRASVADASRWRPRTACTSTPLSEWQIAAHYAELGEYWRHPQPFVDSRDRFDIAGAPRHVLSRLTRQRAPEHWVGRDDDYVKPNETLSARDLQERCMTVGCSPPLVADFRCSLA